MTIDTDKIDKEKEKLKALIKPAIDAFVEETGLVPHFTMVSAHEYTKCGVTLRNPELTISIIL